MVGAGGVDAESAGADDAMLIALAAAEDEDVRPLGAHVHGHAGFFAEGDHPLVRHIQTARRDVVIGDVHLQQGVQPRLRLGRGGNRVFADGVSDYTGWVAARQEVMATDVRVRNKRDVCFMGWRE